MVKTSTSTSMIGPTRRALFGAALVLPILASVPAAAGTALPTGVSSGFSNLIVRLRQQGAAVDVHARTIVQPAKDRAERMIAALPHGIVDSRPGEIGDHLVWSTDKPGHVKAATRIVDMDRRGRFAGAEDFERARAFLATHYWRQRKVSQIKRATGYTEACAVNDSMGDHLAETEAEVVAYPVETAADLQAKLAIMIDSGIEGSLDRIHEDVKRLATREG